MATDPFHLLPSPGTDGVVHDMAVEAAVSNLLQKMGKKKKISIINKINVDKEKWHGSKNPNSITRLAEFRILITSRRRMRLGGVMAHHKWLKLLIPQRFFFLFPLFQLALPKFLDEPHLVNFSRRRSFASQSRPPLRLRFPISVEIRKLENSHTN